MRRLGRLLWMRVSAAGACDVETAEALLEQLCGLLANQFLASCLVGNDGADAAAAFSDALREALEALGNAESGLDPEYCLNAVPLLSQAQQTAEQCGLAEVNTALGEVIQLLKQ